LADRAVSITLRARLEAAKVNPRQACVLALLLLGACQDPDWANKTALRIGAPRADAAAVRERQSTQITGVSEQRVLAEATQVLQDLGFTVEESSSRYGVLAGSKDRDATETGQVVGQVALTIGLALLGVIKLRKIAAI
jgi:hypothetical protein